MARANVEVRRLIDAFNEGGVSEASVGFFDADAVFEESLDQPGSEEAHGQDAVGRTFSRFDEAWEEHRSEPEEIRATDDESVLMRSIEHLRGRDGIEFGKRAGTISRFAMLVVDEASPVHGLECRPHRPAMALESSRQAGQAVDLRRRRARLQASAVRVECLEIEPLAA
jgi:hypothetical protein